jgi:hypothetical protein
MDPLNRQSEDYSQFEDYEGYILSDNTDKFRIMISSGNMTGSIINILKKDVVLEANILKNVARGAAHAIAPTLAGVAGINEPTGTGLVNRGAGALGRFAGNVGRMALSQNPSAAVYSGEQQQGKSYLPLPDNIQRDRPFTVKNDNKIGAYVDFDGEIYKIRSVISIDKKDALYPEGYSAAVHRYIKLLEAPVPGRPVNTGGRGTINQQGNTRPRPGYRKLILSRILSNSNLIGKPVSVQFIGPDNVFYYNKAVISPNGTNAIITIK